MYFANHNLSDVNGDIIAPGTKGIKPEQLGEKEVIERYLATGAITKGDGSEEIAPENVIVTGEVTDEATDKATDKAVTNSKATKK